MIFNNDITLSPLFTASEISRRIAGLAGEIAHDSGGEDLIIIGLLTGAYVFTADLSRELHRAGCACTIDFLTASSYGDRTRSSGELHLSGDLKINIRGSRVLLVDDILDTGLTITRTLAHLEKRGAAACRTCVLLDKPHSGRTPAAADYTGFTIDPCFAVGYGLDFRGLYRELPGIHRLEKPERGDAP